MEIFERNYTYKDMRLAPWYLARLKGAPAEVEQIIRHLDQNGWLSPDQQVAVDDNRRWTLLVDGNDNITAFKVGKSVIRVSSSRIDEREVEVRPA
jgi:hypothetical protein